MAKVSPAWEGPVERGVPVQSLEELRIEKNAIPLKHYAESPLSTVLQELDTNPQQGLTSSQVAQRALLYGRNELEKDPPTPWWKLLINQLSDLLVLMLIAASIFSMVLEEYESGTVIIVIVIANAMLGVVQESKAGAAMEALEELSATMVDVIRDGQIKTIDGKDLVPGDVMMLTNGGAIAADARLIEAHALCVNEMALTGESEPVKKNASYVPPPSLLALQSRAASYLHIPNADSPQPPSHHHRHHHASSDGSHGSNASSHSSGNGNGVELMRLELGPLSPAEMEAAAEQERERARERMERRVMEKKRLILKAKGRIAKELAEEEEDEDEEAEDDEEEAAQAQAKRGHLAMRLVSVQDDDSLVKASPSLGAAKVSSLVEERSFSEGGLLRKSGDDAGEKKEGQAQSSDKGKEKEKAKAKEKEKEKEEALTDANMVYFGCLVQDGHGKALVVKTGMQTKMGEIAYLLKTADEDQSPLHRKLNGLGVRLGVASLLISIVVFIIGVTTGRGAAANDPQPVWLQMLLVAVSLTVAAVPEGLPACVTVTLALGMRHMVEKHALVRNLQSVETLGSATVICTDKTGTLTQGVMSAVRLWFGHELYRITSMGFNPEGYIMPINANENDPVAQEASVRALETRCHSIPLLVARLCSNSDLQFNEEKKAWECFGGNSSEHPLTVAAAKAGITKEALDARYHRIKENPFNSARKMMSTLVQIRDSSSVPGSPSKSTSHNHHHNLHSNSNFKAGPPPHHLAPQQHPGIASGSISAAGLGSGSGSSGSKFAAPLPQFPSFGSAAYLISVKGAPNVVLDHCVAIASAPPDHNGNGNGNGNGNALEPQVRPLTSEERARVLAVVDEFSEQAFRVLAIAYRPLRARDLNLNLHNGDQSHGDEQLSPEHLERDLILAGLVASIDPERPEVTQAIHKAACAGVRTVMITGDYVKTAKAIAENINLLPKGSPDGKAVDCSVVRDHGAAIEDIERKLQALKKGGKNKDSNKDSNKDGDTNANAHTTMAMSRGQKHEERERLLKLKRHHEAQLDALTAYADVFARAKPADKITIVRSLQRQGHICSMTGDGVNDAPALRQANIGVAMGITGTSVAKAASDMVLTDDNFKSIVEAIEEGRTIYANISKFVFYLLSTNVAEVFLILIGVCMGLESPLMPIQILWLNLVTDGAPAIALAIEPTEPNIMNQGPRLAKEPLIERVMLTGIIVQVIVLTCSTLGCYVLGLWWRLQDWDLVFRNGKTLSDVDEARFTSAVDHARTICIYVIVFSELLRAYSARSLRDSLWTVGFGSNRWMHWAVGLAIGATLCVGHIPGLRDIFSMKILEGREWGLIFGLALVPFLVDELQKFVYRRTGFGERPLINLQQAQPHRRHAAEPPRQPPNDENGNENEHEERPSSKLRLQDIDEPDHEARIEMPPIQSLRDLQQLQYQQQMEQQQQQQQQQLQQHQQQASSSQPMRRSSQGQDGPLFRVDGKAMSAFPSHSHSDFDPSNSSSAPMPNRSQIVINVGGARHPPPRIHLAELKVSEHVRRRSQESSLSSPPSSARDHGPLPNGRLSSSNASAGPAPSSSSRPSFSLRSSDI